MSDEFLERWKIDVSAHRDQGWDATKIAANFGIVALQSAFLLNGGALAALPALVPAHVQNAAVAKGAAAYFLYGLALAATSTTFAYLNFSLIAYSLALYADVQARRQHQRATPIASDEFEKLIAPRERRRRKTLIGINATLVAAFLSAIGSFCVFYLGAHAYLLIAR